MGLFLVQIEAEVVTEAAVRTEAGELDGEALQGVVTNLEGLTQMLDQLASMEVPDTLAAAWEESVEAYAQTGEILAQWLDGRIVPADVIGRMEPVRESAAHAMSVGSEVVAGIVGVSASEMAAARQPALAEIVGQAFAPPPVVYGCGEGETEEARASLDGRIAFVSDRDGDPEIYVINADGSGVARLTNSPGGDYHPAWSPDGRRIAFYSERDGNAEIYAMNADGSGITRLTNHSADDYDPSWSPDGTRIAFHTHRYNQNPMVAVMNADGSGVEQLTPVSVGGWSPVWSPDGTQIVFNSSPGTDRDIYLVSVDGSGINNLTDGHGDDWWPDWSPDGEQIVFHSVRDGNFEIYVISPDGEALTRVTDNPAGDYDAGWSPDGAWIAYTSDGGGNLEVCALNVSGTGLANVTDNPANDWGADWGP
jgi:Tol biopolymer transport system component